MTTVDRTSPAFAAGRLREVRRIRRLLEERPITEVLARLDKDLAEFERMGSSITGRKVQP